jgi:hypothetical protein
MAKGKRCGLCGKGTKAHRKANDVRYVRRRSGVSGLKVLKPRSERVRRWEVDGLVRNWAMEGV